MLTMTSKFAVRSGVVSCEEKRRIRDEVVKWNLAQMRREGKSALEIHRKRLELLAKLSR